MQATIDAAEFLQKTSGMCASVVGVYARVVCMCLTSATVGKVITTVGMLARDLTQNETLEALRVLCRTVRVEAWVEVLGEWVDGICVPAADTDKNTAVMVVVPEMVKEV